MSFIDFDNEDAILTSGNPYLADPQKALELIAEVYSGEEKGYQTQRLLNDALWLLKNPLLVELLRIPLSDVSLYNKVQQLTAKIAEQVYFPHLAGKTVIGVGGKFSTGKSCFLNALTECEDLLPTDQKPTTSIPTYLTYGKTESALAYTIFDKSFKVNSDMMHALTHAFYDEYKIGFAKSIKKLILLRPEFPYKGIALLDTPGYNKADTMSANSESLSIDEMVIKSQDARVARAHLQNCDYLIWLVSAESGIIHTTDIDFLKSLSLQQPCLVVLTKADKKTPESLEDILRETKLLLEKTDIPIAGVTSFSSHDRKEYFDKSCIADFIKEATGSGGGQENILSQTKTILEEWRKMYTKHQNSIEQQSTVCKKMIEELWDPLVVASLVSLHKEYNTQSTFLWHTDKHIQNLTIKIFDKIQQLIGDDFK
ncbi:MAG: dynamin family protein [Rickettsiales bacterium]|jgi:GTP-binding protein EngB required for normal cell division|nr:dynamin family protein [Rickettsiales bacterium]